MARNRKKNKKKKNQRNEEEKILEVKKEKTLSLKERNFRVVVQYPGVVRAPRYI